MSSATASKSHVCVGIDDIQLYIPRLYLDMKDFAEARDADYGKLNRGLGLAAMSIPDLHEDPATMGANAVLALIERNEIDPRSIGRIYLGTESAVDGSKPTATYVLDMVEDHLEARYGKECLQRCDVVDMTFACVGGVDALHNTLDWVARGGPEQDRIGIVVFSDNAKYELESPGEYTQGAGSGALLVRHNPRLLAIPDVWGVSTRGVHDFFKPRREVPLTDVLAHAVEIIREHSDSSALAGAEDLLATLDRHNLADGVFRGRSLSLHKDTPVFDGPYSNDCYREAVKHAFIHFRQQLIDAGRRTETDSQPITEQWSRIVLHLPYAFQGKRMFPDVYAYERRALPEWSEVVESTGGNEPHRDDFEPGPEGDKTYRRAGDQFRRLLTKTEQYKAFFSERIEKGQRGSSLVGNQYTGSIFLALVSTLCSDLADGSELTGKRIGLCAYGSGAKAKVFEAEVQPGWKEVVSRFRLFERLETRTRISWQTYLQLHGASQHESVVKPTGEFILVNVDGAGRLEGKRRYAWID